MRSRVFALTMAVILSVGLISFVTAWDGTPDLEDVPEIVATQEARISALETQVAGGTGTGAGQTTAPTEAEATPESAAGAQTHRIDGGDIYFAPSELTVAIGDTIELVNIGVAPHNFAIVGYNDHSPVRMPRDGEVVTWVVPDDLAPGTYSFYCAIPGHRLAGMVGTITVTE